MQTRPEGVLAEVLARCGVAAEAVSVEWDDLCQEDVLSFRGTAFSSQTMACLADLYLTFPSRFVFPSDDLQAAFEAAVRQTPAMLSMAAARRAHQQALLDTHGLADFRLSMRARKA